MIIVINSISGDPLAQWEARWMNHHRQIRFLLREAEMYLQFLTEDLDAIESIGEKSTSHLIDVLSEVTGKLREAANIFHVEITRKEK